MHTCTIIHYNGNTTGNEGRKKVMLLLKIQAGSHLYGYATATSDVDFLEVHSEGFIRPDDKFQHVRDAEQTIVDGMDVTRMTLSHFVEKALKGSHQALDAMFAREPEFDLLQGFRRSYRAGYEVIPTYQRAIIQFATRDGGAFRYQRHAMRLVFNLTEILEKGFYTPELADKEIVYLNETATLPTEEFMKELTRLSPVVLT